MKFYDLLTLLDKNRYQVFSYDDLLVLFPKERRLSLKKMLYRWVKKKRLNRLRRGVYELSFPRDRIVPDLYIANRLYDPSYISLETALSRHSIIPEVSMAVTSVTPGPTRRFRNKHGLFIYRTVKPALFCGYHVETQDGFNVLMADPEKALMDFIYLKTLRRQTLDLSGERIDKRAVSRLSKQKLNRYARLAGLDFKEIHAHL